MFFDDIKILDMSVVVPEKLFLRWKRKINDFNNKLMLKKQSGEYWATMRNATNANYDNIIGKLGECMALNYFVAQGFPKVEIDFEIRFGKKKGWACDLDFKKVDPSLPNVHVKTCTAHTHNYVKDYSWTFQWADKIGNFGKDNLFTGKFDNDLVILIYIPHSDSRENKIMALGKWRYVEDLLKEPMKKSLKGLKKCLYFKDLLNSLKI